jgi:hypothetical protein
LGDYYFYWYTVAKTCCDFKFVYFVFDGCPQAGFCFEAWSINEVLVKYLKITMILKDLVMTYIGGSRLYIYILLGVSFMPRNSPTTGEILTYLLSN